MEPLIGTLFPHRFEVEVRRRANAKTQLSLFLSQLLDAGDGNLSSSRSAVSDELADCCRGSRRSGSGEGGASLK